MDSAAKPCLCASFRKAARVVTKQYDKHLQPSGLKVTQFSILMNITRNPGVTVSELADIMIMDQSTMTRNLQLLEKQGLLDIRDSGADQRAKAIFLSEAGEDRLELARPYWVNAQKDLELIIGPLGFDLLLQSLHTVVEAR